MQFGSTKSAHCCSTPVPRQAFVVLAKRPVVSPVWREMSKLIANSKRKARIKESAIYYN